MYRPRPQVFGSLQLLDLSQLVNFTKLASILMVLSQ